MRSFEGGKNIKKERLPNIVEMFRDEKTCRKTLASEGFSYESIKSILYNFVPESTYPVLPSIQISLRSFHLLDIY